MKEKLLEQHKGNRDKVRRSNTRVKIKKIRMELGKRRARGKERNIREKNRRGGIRKKKE